MEKKKNIIKGSLIAGALVACSSFATHATEIFHSNNLGSGEEVRTNLLAKKTGNHRLELTCSSGSQSGTHKHHKDGKCGDGKCGKDHKCSKDHKCGKKGKKGSTTPTTN